MGASAEDVKCVLCLQGVCQDPSTSLHDTLRPLHSERGRSRGHQQYQQHGEGHPARAGHRRRRSEPTQQKTAERVKRCCRTHLKVKPLTAEHCFYVSASALNLLLLQQNRHLLLRGEGPPETFARTQLLFVGWAVKMRHMCRDNLSVIMWICVMIYKIHIIVCESSAVIWSWFCLCCCSVTAAFNATQHLCPLDQLHTPTRGITTTFKATKCCWVCKEQHLVVNASHQQRAPLSHPTSIYNWVPAAP